MLVTRLAIRMRRVSLRASFTIALALLSFLVVGVGGISLWGIARLEAIADQAVSRDGRMSYLASEVAIHALLMRRYEKDLFISVGRKRELDATFVLWEQAYAELAQAIDQFASAAETSADQTQARVWRESLQAYYDGFLSVRDRIMTGEIFTSLDARVAFDVYHEHITTLTDPALLLADQKIEIAETARINLVQQGRLLTASVVISGIIAMTLAIGWTLLFPSWVLRPMRALRDATARLAHGDMAVRVEDVGRDTDFGALARTFNEMAQTIQENTSALHDQYQRAEDARREAEVAQHEAQERLALIETQRTMIRDMSVPLLPLSHHTLVMPLVGDLDAQRMVSAQERALRAITASSIRYLILDITGITVVDTHVAQGLIQLVRATRLVGARVILVGIRPEVAQTMVHLGILLDEVITRSTLQEGVLYTNRQTQGH